MQVEVTPLENAIETMTSTNDRLQGLITAFEGRGGIAQVPRVDQLSMVLNGVIDAAVNGGIANYKVTVMVSPIVLWHALLAFRSLMTTAIVHCVCV